MLSCKSSNIGNRGKWWLFQRRRDFLKSLSITFLVLNVIQNYIVSIYNNWGRTIWYLNVFIERWNIITFLPHENVRQHISQNIKPTYWPQPQDSFKLNDRVPIKVTFDLILLQFCRSHYISLLESNPFLCLQFFWTLFEHDKHIGMA